MNLNFKYSALPEAGLKQQLNFSVNIFKRLAELHGQQSGSLLGMAHFAVHGEQVRINCSLEGKISLQCHRCADPVTARYAESFEVILSADEAQGNSCEFYMDSVGLSVLPFNGENIDLASIIEDEVLLWADEQRIPVDDDGRCLKCCKPRIEQPKAVNNPFVDFLSKVKINGSSQTENI